MYYKQKIFRRKFSINNNSVLNYFMTLKRPYNNSSKFELHEANMNYLRGPNQSKLT